ncbi:DoxX family protein [Aureliella helgolandensis]|uniref:Inner membrane protein YphA n=1 Tax=Aureliella helgolandensis TaxID=2527968 RepID=A0A518G705_9BACT|nr:DoxX family protein [Aureliella helgolandensis]QDV24365.1 Inner membrane protein YphA [Aureliella helgolandensis]
MSSLTHGLLSLVGRAMISTIFLLSAVGNKIPNFNGVVEYMSAAGVPQPKLMLVGGIVFLLLGSLSVMAGFRTRIGAVLLAVFLVLATYYFHDFWNEEGRAAELQMIQFMKNLSMLGVMVFLFANGPGAFSLDGKLASTKTVD